MHILKYFSIISDIRRFEILPLTITINRTSLLLILFDEQQKEITIGMVDDESMLFIEGISRQVCSKTFVIIRKKKQLSNIYRG